MWLKTYLSYMKYVLLFIAVFTMASCAETPEEPAQQDSVPVIIPAAISDIQPYRPDISKTPWDGDLYDAMYWRDSRGENVVIISGRPQYFWKSIKPEMRQKLMADQDPETFSEATELFAIHYILPKGSAKWTMNAQMSDYRMGCCDVWMEYQQQSLKVIDEDSTGTGEVVFMYNATEADGIIERKYLGNLILMMDTTYFHSAGPTGLGNAKDPDIVKGFGQLKGTLPQGPYVKFVSKQWDIYYAERERLDREAITERNNVDESGHADHVH
jgi:hypothetical protein